MSPRRLLRIVLVEFQPGGGLTHYSAQLADALALRGHDVRVLGPRGSEIAGLLAHAEFVPAIAGFDGRRPLAQGPLSAPRQRLGRAGSLAKAWWDVARYAERECPDVVQLGELRSVLDAIGVAWLRRRRGSAILVDVCHNVLPFTRRRGADKVLRTGPVIRTALAHTYSAMDAVVVHGTDSRHRFAQEWPDAMPAQIIPHGDERIFGDALPPHEGTPTVLFFGSWAGYKGLDLLFDAFEHVRARVPAAHLEVVGSPTREVALEWVLARAARFGSGATAVPGYATVEDAREAFRRASVVALPYREGFQSGVAFLAFTLARPVVCTPVGDVVEAVQLSRGGIVASSDPQTFADALVSLLVDPEAGARMGSRGRRWVMEDSSWEVAAEMLEGVYRRAIDGPRSDAREVMG